MDALRELRAEVPGPSDEQRRTAWERAQGACSQAGAGGEGRGRPWLVAGVAAVAAGVTAVGIGITVGQDGQAPPASTSTSTSVEPTPFATGSVWEPGSAAERTVMDIYRDERIHRLPDGGVRIDIPPQMEGEAMTKALNREGIPIRFWAVAGTKGEWWLEGPATIDGERGVDTSRPRGKLTYPRGDVTAEWGDGPGSALRSLTFATVPTEPVDVSIAQ